MRAFYFSRRSVMGFSFALMMFSLLLMMPYPAYANSFNDLAEGFGNEISPTVSHQDALNSAMDSSDKEIASDPAIEVSDDISISTEYQVGWNKTENGTWIYIDKDGSLHKGWLQEGSYRYYLDPQTGIMKTGLQTIDGKKYFFKAAPSGNMLTGVQVTPDGTYYFNADGTTSSGWIKSGGHWYYFDSANNDRAATGWKTIGNRTYYLHPNCIMAQGWNKIGDDWYYFVSEGSMQKGWLQEGSYRYYLDPQTGIMKTGLQVIDGKKYFFKAAPSGNMLTGVQATPEGMYYFNADGATSSGWIKSGGYWYYFDPGNDNEAAIGWKTIGNRTYYLHPNCTMAQGWNKIGDDWYYFVSEGSMKTGWLNNSGGWYYLDPSNGAMVSGFKDIGGNVYYLDPANDSRMASGWKKVQGKWYYFDPTNDSRMATGWKKLSGGWYYLNPDDAGAMATGWKTVGTSTYYLDPSNDSRMVTGWKEIEGDWYHFVGEGSMSKGWIQIGSYKYYLDPVIGAMLTGVHEIDGVKYCFKSAPSGAMLTNRWIEDGSSLYYAQKDGALTLVSGSMTDDGSIILKDGQGNPLSGFVDIGDSRFYAYPDKGGKLAKGWIQIGDKWYWADSYHRISTGWVKVGSYWYYLYPDKDGEMATGWVKVGSYWYYLNSNGAMQTGWLHLSDGWYYLRNGGEMVNSSCYIDGRWEEFEYSGLWIDPSEAMTRACQGIWSDTNWLLVVDTNKCTMGVYYWSSGRWQLQYYWYCSPGKPSTPTVKGQFTVGNRGYYFDSYGVRCFYWTQFYGNYLFHSVLYAQTSSPQYISDGRTGMQLSHGCVRLDLDNAYWIYANIPRGTKVWVY